jgi:predicted RecA/RadA family phage recombinase
MSTTYRQPGDVLPFTAPTGGVTTGVPLFIGARFVIPMVTAVAAATFEGMVTGVHAYTKTASQAWAEGQKIYWDVANAKFDSSPLVGPFVGFAAKAVGSGSGETTGEVAVCDCCPCSETVTLRKRVAIADVNAGATIVPAIAGRRYRLVDGFAVAIGGAVGAVTTVDILGTVTTARKLIAFGQAALTQSTVVRAGGTGGTLLADGASFTQNDANTALTVGITGSAATTATHIDFVLTYAIDPA